MQGDLDHVLGHEFDQQRDWANTPEDRAWHQGSVKSFKILYHDAYGLGGEVKWDGENAEVISPL
jgi:hypothetical protein